MDVYIVTGKVNNVNNLSLQREVVQEQGNNYAIINFPF